MVCGFRQDVIEKWANGEEIAPPPKRTPNNNPNNPNNPNNQQQPAIQLMKFEYIWLDGNSTKKIRSKTHFHVFDKTNISSKEEFLSAIPESSFDGSSTGQAETEESDLILQPVNFIPNTTERARTPSFIVLCEVLDSDGVPHPSNTREKLRKALDDNYSEGILFGMEQEYVIMDSETKKPVGWKEEPEPQGNYYCGTGADVAIMRDLSESHAMACNSSGIELRGTNAEVMLSQWEYQLKEDSPTEEADNIWMSRFILQRLAERMGMYISYEPKPVDGNWNGSGGHINFSTKHMRENADLSYMSLICSSLEEFHNEAISVYGEDNNKRLTGDHETSSIDEYSWGEMDRSASVRIPHTTVKTGMGHIEDRRPAANVDPYEAFSYLVCTLSTINQEMMIAT